MSQLKKIVDSDARVKPLRLTITAANTPYQLKLTDNVVIATTALDDAAAIIYLPSVAEAVGRYFYVNAPTGATAGDISVYQIESLAEVTTYGDLDADDDWCIYYSSGLAWKILKSGVA